MGNRFEERYRSGDTPWDHGMVDFNLVEVVSRRPVQPCRTLDIGCGTGNNAVWLAQQGFDVIGFDLSATAVERAREKAAVAQAECCFVVGDFLADAVPDAPFGFVFDRGCLHSIPEPEGKVAFAEKVAGLLVPDGLWLTLVGNADEPKREVGPPQLTAAELTAVVEPCFEVVSLASGRFGSDQETPPRAWVCLMKKRAITLPEK
ncbi:class I SAM-dependent methyltransferase [Pontiella sulfatireligans]|uniref:Class I SAM-dependent methyltransferase n=1 Tax=Pontiella sulfatireligans TaxID=2750658 RepID=A0A6C2US06_9BACT|nr:class I SAM-dependent methyltransferase [Pontiella sulfatireligans]VGO23120.1 hypothetical protein SCARR_05223 [Pontiella sulfatireligans]